MLAIIPVNILFLTIILQWCQSSSNIEYFTIGQNCLDNTAYLLEGTHNDTDQFKLALSYLSKVIPNRGVILG